MNKQLLLLGGSLALTAVLSGCGDSDGVELNPTSIDNSVVMGTTVNPMNNPCATFTANGQTQIGNFDGTNCTYAPSFVSDTNPLSVNLRIPSLANSGVHIFQDSLFVGQDVTAAAAQSGVRIPQDNEGPQLTIDAGARIAFSAQQDYLRVARGSRIIAEGTMTNPIIISSVSDLINGTANEGTRGEFGGVQINGNGLTNRCSDVQRMATPNNVHNCHVTAEGRPATYGGNNNAENSGSMRFVQIRFAGFEVVDGDELNCLTLNGVGSGTTIDSVECFTSQDDGIELFGGGVNLKRIVIVNAGDDSIDYSQGYVGNIQFLLILHTSGANRCVEADDASNATATPETKARIANMTCITSNVDTNMGVNPTGKGDSEGPIYRVGAAFEMYNSIITSNNLMQASNECLEIDGTGTAAPSSDALIASGTSFAAGNLIACGESLKVTGTPAVDLNALTTVFTTNGNVTLAPAQLPAAIIAGQDTNRRAFITAGSPVDANMMPINVTLFDVTSLGDMFAPDAMPQIGGMGDSSFFEMEGAGLLGAVSAANDWTQGWTIGLDSEPQQ